MTKTSIATFFKHEFIELTKGKTRTLLAPQFALQSQLHLTPECRHPWATALYSIGVAGFMTAIYRHAHHDDHRQNCPGYFLNVDLGVCSSSNQLGQ